MASGVTAIIVDAALGKAKSTALDNIKLMLGFPEQLDAMKDHVEAIEAVLDDADRKKTGVDSNRVLLWLKNVEGAAFEAVIVLDELFYESLSRRVSENNGDSPQGIQEELKGERFLFVLDDVWEFEWRERLLNTLTHMAMHNSTGGDCRVLVTTRSKEVADGVRAFFNPFELKNLSDDHCWSIIVERVNESGTLLGGLDVHKEQLLKKCQGLPLAAKVIGGLLCIEDRGPILDRISDVDDKIMPVLRFSYDYLPSRCIKSCFVYCSVYPKDAQMDGNELIELWMAQGYLEDRAKRGKTMEEVGAEYLTILSQRSLLEKYWSGRGWTYQMHDFVHDLAETISEEKYEGGKYSAFRHVALGVEKSTDCWNEKSTLTQIKKTVISDESLYECIHARVMHLYLGRVIEIFPKDVGKLIHLRSLTISGECIETLPESLCRLYNLQTLNLSACRGLQCLPQGLSNLISLRHIHFSWPVFSREDFKMPPNMGRLTCLQTLEFFNVREEDGHEIKELGFMENLKGRLSIRNLEVVKSKEEAASAKVDAKKKMIDLEFKWASTTGHNNIQCEDVLEGLEPCSALQRLAITNYMGVRIPRWLAKLSALVFLKLEDCENMTELGYSGDTGFPNLKRLDIRGCGELVSCPLNLQQTPSLSELSLVRCPKLFTRDGTLPRGFQHLTNLKELSIGPDNLDWDALKTGCSTTLRSLAMEMSSRTQLPQQLEEFSSLVRLLIVRFGSLERLPDWLGKLTSLQQLFLLDCPKLEHLPTETIRSLSNLQILCISRCPLLRETHGDEINALPDALPNLRLLW